MKMKREIICLLYWRRNEPKRVLYLCSSTNLMSRAILLAVIFVFIAKSVCAQSVPIPKNYTIIDTASGDLDKDGVKELVVAYDTKPPGESFESMLRELIIYKIQSGKWSVWKRSMQALLGSRDGGMSGDPFEYMEIKNGILMIGHFGGSSWKWGHTDKYRYQGGEFYLIGYSSNSGKLCEEWMNVDFNLSTGTMIVKKEYEKCENEDQVIYKREEETISKPGIKITLQNRRSREIKIVTPKYKHEVYIAMKDE